MGRFWPSEASRPLILYRSWLNWVHLQKRTNAYAAPQSLLVPTVRLPLKTGTPDYETGFLPSQSQSSLCERVSYKIYIRILALLPSTEFGPLYLGIRAVRFPHNYCAPELSHTTLTLRLLMSYIYGAPILDVSRSHTTTQHSR